MQWRDAQWTCPCCRSQLVVPPRPTRFCQRVFDFRIVRSLGELTPSPVMRDVISSSCFPSPLAVHHDHDHRHEADRPLSSFLPLPLPPCRPTVPPPSPPPTPSHLCPILYCFRFRLFCCLPFFAHRLWCGVCFGCLSFTRSMPMMVVVFGTARCATPSLCLSLPSFSLPSFSPPSAPVSRVRY